MADKARQQHNQLGHLVRAAMIRTAWSSRVVFVLTAQGNDLFSVMTRVAVASLRVSNPQLCILVVADRETDEAVRRVGDPLPGEVDEWLVADTPAGDAGFRNRYIKTKLRSLLDGPFLFLDSDILIRGDLREIFVLDCDLAGARNHSREGFAEQVWDQDRATLQAMGWEIGTGIYLNGGVLFYNDTAGARNFASEWHRRWFASATSRDCCRDQPALNSALHVTRPKLTMLPDRFNAQILTEPRVAADAVIWHYYSSAGLPVMTNFDALVQRVLHGARLDYAAIKRMIDCNHPWRCENPVDTWVARALMRKNSLDGWESAWLRRERGKYAAGCMHKLWAKARRVVARD